MVVALLRAAVSRVIWFLITLSSLTRYYRVSTVSTPCLPSHPQHGRTHCCAAAATIAVHGCDTCHCYYRDHDISHRMHAHDAIYGQHSLYKLRA